MAKLETLQEGFGHYRTIYADPPWKYKNVKCRGWAEYHYATMSEDDLMQLPVRQMVDPEAGAYLWMWVTWPKLRDGLPQALLEAWGFLWKSEIVWDKIKMGLGYYARVQTEVLIIAVSRNLRDKERFKFRSQRDIVSLRSSRRHSEKPAEFRTMIERLSPEPRIELFTRHEAPGWDRWGLEAPE